VRNFIQSAAIACALLYSSSASAALIADFRLDGNLNNSAGGALTLTNNNGGVLGANGISFGRGQGPDINGFSTPSAYSVETRFSFQNTSGYRRVLDFSNGTDDRGLYILNNSVNFYPIATGGTFSPNTLQTLVFTRNAAGNAAAYVDGALAINFTNASLTSLSNILRLFRDDGAVGGENSAGFVDYVRVYDTALSAQEVANLTPPSAVPEPATWFMMLLGFGMIGFAMRRRTNIKVSFA
jgi:hypothetical protein